MANKPPKHPSAANMGMCVRTYNDGVYHDIDPALSAGGGCGWLVVCGISVGVSYAAVRIAAADRRDRLGVSPGIAAEDAGAEGPCRAHPATMLCRDLRT